jgi:hypothetical protein
MPLQGGTPAQQISDGGWRELGPLDADPLSRQTGHVAVNRLCTRAVSEVDRDPRGGVEGMAALEERTADAYVAHACDGCPSLRITHRNSQIDAESLAPPVFHGLVAPAS